MINLFFKRTKKDGVDISLESDAKTLSEIKEKAKEKSDEEYREALKKEIKNKLYEKYKISDGVHISMHSIYAREAALVGAILDDMIDGLGLVDC